MRVIEIYDVCVLNLSDVVFLYDLDNGWEEEQHGLEDHLVILFLFPLIISHNVHDEKLRHIETCGAL